MWQQNYDPLGNSALSTIAAAIPVVTVLALIATRKVKAHWAALIEPESAPAYSAQRSAFF